jgi:hypothetical protein
VTTEEVHKQVQLKTQKFGQCHKVHRASDAQYKTSDKDITRIWPALYNCLKGKGGPYSYHSLALRLDLTHKQNNTNNVPGASLSLLIEENLE